VNIFFHISPARRGFRALYQIAASIDWQNAPFFLVAVNENWSNQHWRLVSYALYPLIDDNFLRATEFSQTFREIFFLLYPSHSISPFCNLHIVPLICSALLYSIVVLATCEHARVARECTTCCKNARAIYRTHLHPAKDNGCVCSRDSHVSILKKGFPVPRRSFIPTARGPHRRRRWL